MTAQSELPTEAQIRALLDEVAELAGQIAGGVPIPRYDEAGRRIGQSYTPGIDELLRLADLARRDGFPARSWCDGAGRSTVTDDENVPMPPITDPTGEAATDNITDDPIHRQTAAVVAGILEGLDGLSIARDTLARAFRGRSTTKPGKPGCSSCSRFRFEPDVYRNGRCRFCYDFWLAEGVDPPVELLEARAAGRRITPSLRIEALARANSKPGARARRRNRRARVAHP